MHNVTLSSFATTNKTFRIVTALNYNRETYVHAIDCIQTKYDYENDIELTNYLFDK